MKIPTVDELVQVKSELNSDDFYPLVEFAFKKGGSHEMKITLDEGYTAEDVKTAIRQAGESLPEERTVKVRYDQVGGSVWAFTIQVVEKIRRPRKAKLETTEANGASGVTPSKA